VEPILEYLRPFLADRIRYILGLAGYAYDKIEAALAAGVSNLPDLRARVDAPEPERFHPPRRRRLSLIADYPFSPALTTSPRASPIAISVNFGSE
jgi:hypothetical protein